MITGAKKHTYWILSLLLIGLSTGTWGQDAPRTIQNFILKDATGQTIELNSYRDKQAIVVIFTSSNCSWANNYEERISSLHTQFMGRNVAFIGINANDASVSQRDQASQMRSYSPFDFPYLKDSLQEVARQFGATKNPEVFVLKPVNGTFTVAYQGRIDDNPLDPNMVQQPYLVQALEALLNGKTPATRQTRPQGCSIRWSDTVNR